jgi:hypothetical protein
MSRRAILAGVVGGSFLWWCIYKIALWIEFLRTGIQA